MNMSDMSKLLRPVVWLARKAWNSLLWRVMPYLSYLRNRHVSPVQAVLSWPETKPVLGPRVVVFVHFDSSGEVRPYVQHYVRSLNDAGCSVLFVSNAGKLRAEAIESIKPFCAGILVRRNVGYDFAAMREGLSHFGLPHANTEMLIIVNDSVYGPLIPLNDMLARIDFEKADFWGATESWQSRYHLQSFFMVAGPRLMRHEAWSSFWDNVYSVPNKRWVITRYEVGITQWMLKRGIRCAAVWEYNDIVRDIDPDTLRQYDSSEQVVDPVTLVRRTQSQRIQECYVNRIALNPTSDMWRQLLRAGFPFLKRELLRDNPTHVSDIMEWRDVVQETSGFEISLIERDLQRLMRNRAS